MNDQNPYDPPARDGAQRGDRFWIGALVGCLGAVVFMSLLLVVLGAGLFFVRASPEVQPVEVKVGPLENETVEELEEIGFEVSDGMIDVEVVPDEAD